MKGKTGFRKYPFMLVTPSLYMFLFCIFLQFLVPVGSLAKTEKRIEIIGPDQVEENSTADYEAVCIYGEKTKSITQQVQWTVECCTADIDSMGKLTTYEVDADKSIIIRITFNRRLMNRTTTKAVTILDKGQQVGYSHTDRFATYEGSKTCNECHLEKALELHDSVHYQWQGPTPYAVDMTMGGKLGSINDFCTYPDINFIGILTNLDGQKIDGGCATCHVGLGGKPDSNVTVSQLENMDCLVCHSDSYRRKVVQLPEGGFRFVPAPEKLPPDVSLIEAITDIRLPSSSACVNCHSYAGGGCNNKRGDLEESHRDPPDRVFDVHMASKEKDGGGLDCLDCHTARNHKIAGRGTDLRPTDLDVEVSCTNCHEDMPHHEYNIDIHTKRVDCTVCHIPFFAKVGSTDMFRDFSQPAEVNPGNLLYEPHIERGLNVIPEYRFFNGLSFFYQFATPAIPSASGRIVMSAPLGTINDEGAKIEALKHHMAVQARSVDTLFLIPLKMGILFQTADVDKAIRQGASEMGWSLPEGYEFVPTERYMGLYHEVAPKEHALSCEDCHSGGTRLDFDALGYTPRTEYNKKPLCASCHEDKSSEWPSSEFFFKVHEKHVKDKHIDCVRCHFFSTAK
ncbi:MAG: hypothetical protein ACMUHX_04190 [bacterium]